MLAVAIAAVTVGFTARDAAVARERATASATETALEAVLARRAQAATASRLTDAATAYAAATRAEALDSAAGAEAAAADVQRAATAVLTGDALAPLVDARQELAALTEGLSSVTRSSDVLRAARGLAATTDQIRAATSDAIADQDRHAAEAAASAAADLARRVAVAAAAPNGRIPLETLCGVAFAPGARLRCDAAAALDRLDSAFHAARGGHLVVVSSYRDLADQVEVKASRGDLASTPGASNHGRGLAVDLGGLGTVDDFAEPTYLWLKAHAASYGWHHPTAMEPGGGGPLEPWHWEFGTA
ncbi:D-alanyl-D-alanine carboxypeptidase [mine drainage metagenome]|uniref:D-alanyl-D-alanine carboxypeptidase n=1 Tax=mine drainage metagenome TaxID=410659 RepID=A0A1J5RAT5_9ZZZZ